MAKNDIRRLKNEADIATVIQFCGIPVSRKGSANFIPCPLPKHDDLHPTNCYYKDGWNNVYCTACGATVMAIDLIMYTLGYEYGEACDLLWELEGKPDWYHAKRGKKKERHFNLNPDDAKFIGVHYPSRIMCPIREQSTKPERSSNITTELSGIDSYLVCQVVNLSWRDFMNQDEYVKLVRNKAAEKGNKYVEIWKFILDIKKTLEGKGISSRTNDIILESAIVGYTRCKEIYIYANTFLQQSHNKVA